MIKSTAIDPSVIGADGVYRIHRPGEYVRDRARGDRRNQGGPDSPGDVLVLICRGPMGAGMEETYQLT